MDKFYTQDIGLTYDDVLLVPEKSRMVSRTDVDLSTMLGKHKLKYPIMSAAMDTITNGTMAKTLAEYGAVGVIHRFQSVEQRITELQKVNRKAGVVSIAIGLQDSMEDCVRMAEFADILSLDVAHAHHTDVLKFIDRLRPLIGNTLLVGNIVTRHATYDFINAGVDVVKVGIGGGGVCSTRLVTGFGFPNLSAILEVKEAIEHLNAPVRLVADGGIRSSADMAKALAAGADCVMLGSLLSGTRETPGEYEDIIENGVKRRKKKYRGMSSQSAQIDWRGGLKVGTVAEGVSIYVDDKGSVVDVLDSLMGGLRSAFTYGDAANLEEFYKNTKFIKTTTNVLNESKPHASKDF